MVDDPGRVHRGALILIYGYVEISEHHFIGWWLYQGALLVQQHPLLLDGSRDLRRSLKRSLQVKWQVSRHHLIWYPICLIDGIPIPPVIHQSELASRWRDRGRQLILLDHVLFLMCILLLSLLYGIEICLRSSRSGCQLLSCTQARLPHNKLLLTLLLLRRGLERLYLLGGGLLHDRHFALIVL